MHTVALYTVWYNYVKQHNSLKGLLPAMAAGISRTLWSTTDLAGIINASRGFRAPAQLRVTCCKIRITTTQCVIDNSKKAITAPAPDGGRLASKALIPLVP